MIGSIVGGAIIGALARFFMKGKQNMGMIVTIILGILGSAGATFILNKVWPSANNTGGIDWIHLGVSVIVAIVLISIYLKIFNKTQE